jgi:hypothetical protein
LHNFVHVNTNYGMMYFAICIAELGRVR